MKLKLKHITSNFVAGETKALVISTQPERIVYIGTIKELKNSKRRFFKRLRKSRLVAIRSGYKYYENIYDEEKNVPDRNFRGYTVFQIDTRIKGLDEVYIECYKETF